MVNDHYNVPPSRVQNEINQTNFSWKWYINRHWLKIGVNFEVKQWKRITNGGLECQNFTNQYHEFSPSTRVQSVAVAGETVFFPQVPILFSSKGDTYYRFSNDIIHELQVWSTKNAEWSWTCYFYRSFIIIDGIRLAQYDKSIFNVSLQAYGFQIPSLIVGGLIFFGVGISPVT